MTVRVEPADALSATLVDTLRQVNEWLRFAEGKNAGIVGFASAGTLALATIIPGRTDDGPWTRAALAGSALFIALSLVAGLASFLPRTGLTRLLGEPTQPMRETDNLLFYGHLARYAPAELAAAVARRYCGGTSRDIGPLHVDLGAQIVANARITVGKLRLFTGSVICFTIAVSLLMATVVATAFA